MKKNIVFLVLFLILAPIYSQSERSPFETGNVVLNLAVGNWSTLYAENSTISGNASIEYGFKKLGSGIIGVGIAATGQNSSFQYGTSNSYYQYDFKGYTLSLRGTYHPDVLNTKVFDIFGIVQLGSNFISRTITPNNSPILSNYPDLGPSSRFQLGLLLGTRIYIKPKIALLLEAGYDVSPLKAGVSFKF